MVTKKLLLGIILATLGCSTPKIESELDTNGTNNNSEFKLEEFDNNYSFIQGNSKIKDQNFYWTTLIEFNSEVNKLIKSNETLSSFLVTAIQRLNTLTTQENLSANDYVEALKFSDFERVTISTAIKEIVEKNQAVFNLLSDNDLGPSGAFIQFNEVKSVSRLNQLIVDDLLTGVNHIIDVYGAGIDPLYPKLDAVNYNVHSDEYKLLLKNLINELNTNSNQYELFYEPFLDFAIGLMHLNSRDTEGIYFPIQNGENNKTISDINQIVWDNYNYSAIVVLGDSPNSSGDAINISDGGKQRADRGVELFKQGKAPLIVFSGGHVWPVNTVYSEAIEMKKYVLDKYDIPENRILVDPQARHTTTNLRNVGRLIFRSGIPHEKKAIISTTKSQIDYIASQGYSNRCQKEMNHIPADLYNRLSDFEIEFTSLIEVLHIDSSDPLDP